MIEGHENPYRAGDSHILFAYMQKNQIFTKAELIEYAVKVMGKTFSAAKSQVQTLISPTKYSKRGDCRGQYAAEGHLYYIARLPRKFRFGVKEPKKLQLKWRQYSLERRWRTEPVRKDAVQNKLYRSQIKALTRKLAKLQKEVEAVKV